MRHDEPYPAGCWAYCKNIIKNDIKILYKSGYFCVGFLGLYENFICKLYILRLALDPNTILIST